MPTLRRSTLICVVAVSVAALLSGCAPPQQSPSWAIHPATTSGASATVWRLNVRTGELFYCMVAVSGDTRGSGCTELPTDEVRPF